MKKTSIEQPLSELFNQTTIYLQDFPIRNINKNLLETLEVHYKKTIKNRFLYSDDGIYYYDSDQIFKLTPCDKEPFIYNKDNYNAIVDSSFYEKKEVYSQIPSNHDWVDSVSFCYCIGEKSQVYFVIEGTYKRDKITLNTTTQMIHSKYHNFVPLECYFSTKDPQIMDNILLKKELNMFISLIY